MFKFRFFFALLPIAVLCMLFTDATELKPAEEKIRWYTWDEAVKANATTPKKIMIDLYTDWCGWCKVMDRETFPNPDITAYINQNFYAVKFDAEQTNDIFFQDHTFKYQINPNGRGVHELAATLLDGKLGYPSLVYLMPNYERILISPGYKPAADLMPELKFVQTDAFRTQTFEAYKAAATGKN